MRSQLSIYRAGLLAALLLGSALAPAGAEPTPPAAQAAPKTESAGLDGAWIAVGLAAALLIFAFTRKSGQEVPPANPTSEPIAAPEPPTTPAEPSTAGTETPPIEPGVQAAPVEPAQPIAEAQPLGEPSERPAEKMEQPPIEPEQSEKEASTEPSQAPPESTS